MTSHANARRRYYAAQSPRGYGNEIQVHVFPSRAARDGWVREHAEDGDVNAARCGAYAISAQRARHMLGWRGTVTVANMHTAVCHDE